MSYGKTMKVVSVELPADLVMLATPHANDPSKETAKLLALELYREDKISMGRAAELCQTSLESFIAFAGEHEVPMHYGMAELEEDRRTSERLRL